MFSDTVRAHRRRLGMTQEELAGRTGVSVRNIHNIESGRIHQPRPATLRLLADAFGLCGTDREQFCQSVPTDMPRAGNHQAAAGVPLTRPVPAQLPADVAGFAGRTDQLDRLTALLDGSGGPPATVVISAIAGTAGVGKTALALHWAHQTAHRFPDGQIYVNLRGFDPSGSVMAPADAIRGFLDAFGTPAHMMPTDLHVQAALYRSLLAGKRVLVVLDNARDASQVRPLLPGTPGCLALVTSRNPLTGLVAGDGAQPLFLDLLTTGEAHEVLVRRLGTARVDAEPDAAADIIALCGRLPLAIAVVAAHAATYPQLSLAMLADQLRDAGVFDALDGGDPGTNVRTVLSWSYNTLGDQAARLFRLLGLHPGPDISLSAAASLAGLARTQIRPLLAELVRAQLAIERVPGRFTFHDLLRAYAGELAHVVDTGADRDAALHRLVDYYLHTAHAADLLLLPYTEPIGPRLSSSAVIPERLADQAHARNWFDTEHQVLQQVIRKSAELGLETETWQLVKACVIHYDKLTSLPDILQAHQIALDAAQRIPDRSARAFSHLGLVYACGLLGNLDDADRHAQQALHLGAELGGRLIGAHAHRAMSWLLSTKNEPGYALQHALRARDLYRAEGNSYWEATTLNIVACAHSGLGDHEQAIAYGQQAIGLAQKAGATWPEASTWDTLGIAHHRLGEFEQAITCYQLAIELLEGVGDWYNQAGTLVHLGDTYCAAHSVDSAVEAWRRALTLFGEFQHTEAREVRIKLDNLKDSARYGS